MLCVFGFENQASGINCNINQRQGKQNCPAVSLIYPPPFTPPPPKVLKYLFSEIADRVYIIYFLDRDASNAPMLMHMDLIDQIFFLRPKHPA